GGLHISAGRQIEHALTRLRAQRLTDLFGHLAFRGAVAEDAIDRATETAIEDYYAGARPRLANVILHLGRSQRRGRKCFRIGIAAGQVEVSLLVQLAVA